MGLFGGSLGEIGNIAVAAIPGVGQYVGQQEANQANVQMAQEANAMSQANSREQMAFQERMSSTAHQREVADLKAAGLNPLASASGSGSSSPAGASGAVTAGHVDNPNEGVSAAVTDGVSKLAGLFQTAASLRLNDAQVANINADTLKKGVDTDVAKKGLPAADFHNRIYDMIKPLLKSASEKVSATWKDIKQTKDDYKLRQAIDASKARIGRP